MGAVAYQHQPMTITIAGETYAIHYTENAAEIDSAVSLYQPKWITYDTESNGLHIKRSRAFLGAVCWDGVVFVFPMTPAILQHMPKWCKKVRRVYAHNTTFDMHMTANTMDDDKFPLRITNWGDTMGLARLTFQAISARDGGDRMALKEIGAKYIDPNAVIYETRLKTWLKDKEDANFKMLVNILQTMFGKKGWGIKRIEKIVNGEEQVSDDVAQIIETWKADYPVPTYADVPMEILLPYLAVDVILCNIFVRMSGAVVVSKEQQEVAEREFKLIKVNYKMERSGIRTDLNYLRESSSKLKAYIETSKQRMWELAGCQFEVGQHKLIKDIFEKRLGYRPESTDKQFLNKLKDKDELARLISRVRRLEKWQSTYIDRILENAEYDGRFYSTLNSFNPVSGRYSGDAQQFPKERILTAEGDAYEEEHGTGSAPQEMEIFYPRRAFIPTGNGYDSIYYLDYSQVELRVQGHYTLYFGGDLNLCRAYMPFNCRHYLTGEWYDYTNPFSRKRWIELREGAPSGKHWEDLLADEWSVWIVPETGKPWIPTDVHSATSLNALDIIHSSMLARLAEIDNILANPNMQVVNMQYMLQEREQLIHDLPKFDKTKMSKKELKHWRNIGKRFNFMRNYGGGDAKASETLEIPLEQAKAMNNGYTKAFPLVVTYQREIIKTLYKFGYMANMYGRRYYLSDSNKFYKVANYLIQGSSADMLKIKMLEIDEFLERYNCQSRLLLCVHDELQFEVMAGEQWIIPHIKAIMEDTPTIMLPIVAEVERTTTTWAEKSKVLDFAA